MTGEYQSCTIKVPFRVDLRDLAKWLSGVDPFQSQAATLEEREPRSLEGFLAGQVRFMSGGHRFDVVDLTAIARASHLLLALDGFDEVADVELRQQLVTEITRGANRLLSAGGFLVQTAVTSRPAAFAKSVRFPRDQWAYFELLPLQRKHVDLYTAKWTKAKDLKEAESGELYKILDVKLRESHTQYLAKNPMQLTILLSLIHTRGASLPEKRTAMYDAYMDMFFSRESGKSDIVRDNRDLLIDILRYLAWQLHTAAEAGENGGIEKSQLRTTLFLYLDSQGENTSIVDALFNGIVERVGVLVSRVLDTYEFEVQPLREYFVARYLYDTAPYSPAGDERFGTKIDRFDALLRNPYWLNVVRFYGGCFSKGELPALVEQLLELASDVDYKKTSIPRSTALMFVSDWVFTQHQPSAKKVLSLVLQWPELRQLLAIAEQSEANEWAILPDRSGRSDFLSSLWEYAFTSARRDERGALARAIRRNSSLAERTAVWLQGRERMSYVEWIALGADLQIFERDNTVNWSKVTPVVTGDMLQALLSNSNSTFFRNGERVASAKTLLLNEIKVSRYIDQSDAVDFGPVGRTAAVCSYSQYVRGLNAEERAPLRDVMSRRIFSVEPKPISRRGKRSENSSEIEPNYWLSYQRFLSIAATTISSSSEPWSSLVEALRADWGDCPAIDRIAFIAAGIRSKTFRGQDQSLETATDLVAAARFHRLKSGSPQWWRSQLNNAPGPAEMTRLLALLWTWGTERTLLRLAGFIDEVLEGLSIQDWDRLCSNEITLPNRRKDKYIKAQYIKLPSGTRACMFIGKRLAKDVGLDFARNIAEASTAAELPQLQFAMDSILEACAQSGDWVTDLPVIKALYAKGAYATRRSYIRDNLIEIAAAEIINNDQDAVPLPLVAMSDSTLRSAVGSKARKILDVAKIEMWF